MKWNEKQRKTAAGAILIGVAAIAITTVVMAAGMGEAQAVVALVEELEAEICQWLKNPQALSL